MVNPVEQKYDYLGRMQTITFDDGEVINYRYNHGGQIESVTGTRSGTNFNYVTEIGYDEFAQRVYIEYGSGIRTRYTYNPYRRWLDNIQTGSSYNETEFQNIIYEFDKVGNLTKYTNNTRGHSTTQEYTYDGLYQLTEAQGNSKSHPYGSVNSPDYTTTYRQTYQFDIIGNMATKTSTNNVSIPDSIGDALNYNLDYQYINGTHKASRIGNRYYSYDQNGNVIAERDGSHATAPDIYRPYYYDGDIYSTDYGFGVVRPQGNVPNDGVYQRNYRWNERNLLTESSDSAYTVNYRYGADGQRALKHVVNNNITTLYFNKMWTKSSIRENWLQSKHIYLGEERIATKFNVGNNTNTADEQRRIYYYHTDHLGSAQTITNWEGVLHERLEYTPYGELWINYIADTAPQDATPFRFTGQELDKETGLYYYGARYLDPRTSRWLSTDPAMYQGDYIPGAPVNDEARKRNDNLPGMGGVYNYVNLHVYHYAGNNPIKYVDPDGRLFLLDDFVFSFIGNIIGVRDDEILKGTWHNFKNTWAFLGSKLIPGSLLEIGFSAAWGIILPSFFGPIGLFIGFFTPAFNIVAGFGAVTIFGGTVTTDGLTTNIHIKGKWNAVSLGSVIIGDDYLYRDHLPHEQGHYAQSLLLGPFYWSIIAIPSIIHAGIYKRRDRLGKENCDYNHFYTEAWAEAWKRKK